MILNIHASGGVSSCLGDTPEKAKQVCLWHLDYYARSCVVTTAPYKCVPIAGVTNGWDATLPQEFRDAFGDELMKLYADTD